MQTEYADDVCVLIRRMNNVSALQRCPRDFSAVSSGGINWNKSTALWCGKSDLSCALPPLLPQNLVWRTDGVKYLAVYLGNHEMEMKNWEGVLEQIKYRLKTWEGLLKSLSYKGRTLVINNLIATKLWYRITVLQPSNQRIMAIQRMLVNLFWSGYHWLQPEILYYPRKEGGQGVINIFGGGE